jgi:hypothetical protein
MTMQKKIELAKRLHLVGVSKDGVVELLWKFPLERIEAQLEYLPYRKAKRPEAMIIESIRKNYSPPKEFYYARSKSELTEAFESLDEGSEFSPGSAPADSQGHRIESAPNLDPPNKRLAEGRQSNASDLPDFDPTIR